ncbi:alpha/beta fold hydrolase [Marilutibacter chinensis]|uniref:Alpha/beta hydrolase n=1 Tax=Marilutibacter chinensis TaxID=2912247 RepID=A0ABS9HYE2_9GAMM|nr:alpha/beta hydrolase [Lysobacter chinensis]MCF7223407.1 alpha/beta hydrolase [Lysobacter chinensis]
MSSSSPFCKPVSRWIAIAVAIMAAIGSGQSKADTHGFRDIRVEVVGEGRPVLMIPGLNSAGETWTETCAALQADHVQCHIVTLPGFAGQPAIGQVAEGDWLDAMRDRLLDYVEVRKLERPVVMGHSLGGFVALQMAVERPAAFDRVIVVDALAFLGAVQNPAATAESSRPMAEAMRTRMREQDEAAYRAGIVNAVQGMTRDPRRVDTLVAWGEASDRATTAQAMYEMLTLDLRGRLGEVRVPTLVLGSWAAYARFGATRDSVEQTFKTQYAELDGARIELSDDGYHFLMWDDPQWLQAQVRDFLPAAGR